MNKEEDEDEASQDSESALLSLHKPYAVVGIIVAVSRVEGFLDFLDKIPNPCGLSFLVMLQGEENERIFPVNRMILHTSMSIIQARDQVKLVSNHIYFLPPHKEMSINSDLLLFSDPISYSPSHNSNVDRFMIQLAESFGKKTICILFNGVDMEGVQGIEAIKQVDGIVLVEDIGAQNLNLSASELSMERTDYVATPQEMSKLLLEYIAFYNHNDKRPLEEELSKLFSMLRLTNGVDFSSYKQASIIRRVQRRMGVKGFDLLYDYNQFLSNNPEELIALQKDLLIGVTQFFRDPDAFAIFTEKVLPSIFESRSQESQIRVWVAGCSTGEEVYSFAILFKQYMEKMDVDIDIKIFATDLDKGSIHFASRGIYPEAISKHVSPEQLRSFFLKKGNEYQVNKEIRQMIVFAHHNILKDPPFIQLDLISCRNLLIYIKPEMQRKIISLLHFASRPGSYLLLGPSETLGKLSNLFKPIDTKWNLYQYKEMNQWLSTGSFSISDSIGPTNMTNKGKVIARLKETEELIKLDNIYTKLIEEYITACIIVDENNEIVHINGSANKYLIIPKGKPSHNLFKMIPSYLSVPVGTALNKVRKEQKEVVYNNIQIKQDNLSEVINLIAKPFNVHSENDKLAIIFFEKIGDISHPAESPPEGPELQNYDQESNTSQHIKDLEYQLYHAKESLQATIEELETSNEEFQASNEELIVANEELQSTNEELQSLNEELMAVNNEFQSKIQELSELNNDMSNFFVSTDIATIFLDTKMKIRKFTPAATNDINLIEFDIGRSFADIAHHFEYDHLIVDAENVLNTATVFEKEVRNNRGKWFIVRISPYLRVNNCIDGVVITFIDISEIKKINDELTVLAYAIQQSPGSIVITDKECNILYVNTKYTEQTGYTLDEVIHTKLKLYSDQLLSDQLMAIWEEVSSGKKWMGEMQNKHRNGEVFYEMVSLLPIINLQGEVTHLLKISENMMEQKHTMELLHKSEMLSAVGQLAAGVAHEIRNPLTALKGFTKLLEPETEKKHYIEIMTSELDRIEMIINELLVLAKPQKLNYVKQDIFNILKDVIALLEPQALLNNVDILAQFTSCTPLVNCVPNQLKQVFINIIKNAIEAMPNGGDLIIKSKLIEKTHIVICFIDQGVGISENTITKLGDPFYTTKENGTGLGLMVSYKIIENHKGKMNITSILGKGTTVDIRFNVAND